MSIIEFIKKYSGSFDVTTGILEFNSNLKPSVKDFCLVKNFYIEYLGAKDVRYKLDILNVWMFILLVIKGIWEVFKWGLFIPAILGKIANGEINTKKRQ